MSVDRDYFVVSMHAREGAAWDHKLQVTTHGWQLSPAINIVSKFSCIFHFSSLGGSHAGHDLMEVQLFASWLPGLT